jgi:hypothetical protein
LEVREMRCTSVTPVAAVLVSLVLLVGCTTGATPSLTPSQDPIAAASASATLPTTPSQSPAVSPTTPPPPAHALGPGTWVETRGVPTGAWQPVAVPAAGGRVLLLDADEPCYFPGESSPEDFGPSPAKVFEPGTLEFSQTASFDKPRFGFVVAPLPDGRALVAGGHNEQGIPKSSTRIWDPITGKWSEGGLMTLARDNAVSAVLHDGRVLVAGGDTPSQVPTGTAEIYDPSADVWTPTGSLQSDNPIAAAVALSDGRVLALQLTDADSVIFGGGLYDPGHGTWANVEQAPGKWGSAISLVALPDGTALLVGGSRDVLRYDPGAGWSTAGRLMTTRPTATATLLRDGRVLVAGGVAGSVGDGTARALKSAELFDPRLGTSSKAAPMPVERTESDAVLLVDGSVLVAGGALDANPADVPWCPTLAETAVRWIP